MGDPRQGCVLVAMDLQDHSTLSIGVFRVRRRHRERRPTRIRRNGMARGPRRGALDSLHSADQLAASGDTLVQVCPHEGSPHQPRVTQQRGSVAPFRAHRRAGSTGRPHVDLGWSCKIRFTIL